MKRPRKLGSTRRGSAACRPKSDDGERVIQRFHERFGVIFDTSESRRRFVNRVQNEIFSGYEYHFPPVEGGNLDRDVANLLGEVHELLPALTYDRGLHNLTHGDFLRTLQVVELIHAKCGKAHQAKLSAVITNILGQAEVDLGIRWKHGHFQRGGAQLLDDSLVTEPLQWLAQPRYQAVRSPFEKGLRHFLESLNRPELLSNVVTDMYESVEALAKIVTERNRDLSGNREQFISRLKVADEYRQLLKDYIEYANRLSRHAAPGW